MKPELIDIKTVESSNLGKLSFFESEHDIPFDIKRIYYIYRVPCGARRGGHAHRKLTQILVCLYGVIEVLLDDGISRSRVILDDPSRGLIIRDMTWREMVWRQEGSVLGVAASTYYDESDYIRDYEVFIRELSVQQDKQAGSQC